MKQSSALIQISSVLQGVGRGMCVCMCVCVVVRGKEPGGWWTSCLLSPDDAILWGNKVPPSASADQKSWTAASCVFVEGEVRWKISSQLGPLKLQQWGWGSLWWRPRIYQVSLNFNSELLEVILSVYLIC